MNECAGTWNSRITWTRRGGKPVPSPTEMSDGTVTIKPHGSSTKIEGKHKKVKERDIENGQCTPDASGAFSITFQRDDDESGQTERFIYNGTGKGDKISGTVDVPDGDPTGGDTGTWEADRSGGGGVPDDDDKDKGRGRDKREEQSSGKPGGAY